MAKRRRLKLNDDVLSDLDAAAEHPKKNRMPATASELLRSYEPPPDMQGIGHLTRTSLDPKLIDDFCQLVREGHPADTVCNYLGIMPTQYYGWKTKGEQYLNGDGEPKEFYLYGAFVAYYRKAFAEYVMDRNRSLHDPDNERWFRDMEILSRRDRKTWSRDEPAGGEDNQFQSDDRFL